MINTVWSRKMAYAVGLLATDGHLSKDGRHIDLTSKDVDQLMNFQKCIGQDHKIYCKRVKGARSVYFHIQFSDVKFYNWLLSIGLKQQKTKLLSDISVPDEYFLILSGAILTVMVLSMRTLIRGGREAICFM